MANKQQRQGVASRLVWYKEPTYGVDTGITDGFVVPLSDTSGFELTRGNNAVNVFTGRRRFPGVVSGNATAEGDIVPQMDFSFMGHPLIAMVGAGGYTRVGNLHQFVFPDLDGALPGSLQLEQASLETTVQYLRARGVYVNGMKFQGQQQGGASYTVSLMGNGDKVVGLVPLDATPTVYPFKAVDYFNGFIKLGGIPLVGCQSFNVGFNNNFSRTDAFFNGGIASSLNAGIPTGTGTLGLIMAVPTGADPEDTINFYNMAINQQDVPIECMWANAPLLAGPTEWFHLRLMARFGEKNWKPAGAVGIMIEQNFDLLTSELADWAGENVGTVAGPYVITGAVNDKLGVKVDGGLVQTVSLTAGAARTAAQIVTDINALPLVGAVADVFNARVRIVSSSTGATSSVQIDTAVPATGHAALGFGATIFTGAVDTPFIGKLHNSLSVDY